ncbi:hypothetical protein PIB30_060522 [Stylosanthes scabra]|uniref:Uncharacterized protein n=1 Tax=Stylosanthes scabra TaxID=79078 RepID=A0ABU6TLH7_9FABA|nr:hypothetical protein [Stylosanthes scabra]
MCVYIPLLTIPGDGNLFNLLGGGIRLRRVGTIRVQLGRRSNLLGISCGGCDNGAAGGGIVGATCKVPGVDVEGEGEGICSDLGTTLPPPRLRPRDDVEDALLLSDLWTHNK